MTVNFEAVFATGLVLFLVCLLAFAHPELIAFIASVRDLAKDDPTVEEKRWGLIAASFAVMTLLGVMVILLRGQSASVRR